MPLFKSQSLDADIKVDWQKRTVNFENEAKIKKSLLKSIFLSLILSTFAFGTMLYTNHQKALTVLELQTKSQSYLAQQYLSEYNLYSTTEITSLTIFTFLFTIMILVIPSLPAFSEKIRKFTVNNRTKKSSFYTYSIINPSGLIKLDIHGVDPIVDLEFTESVSKFIKSVNLVKIPLTKRRKRIQLQVDISEPTIGELIVKEYF
jgi:hypothetical protein